MKTTSIRGHILFYSCLTIILLASCKKGWLDAKPVKSLVVPSTIKDYQALLDNVDNGNGAPFNDHQSTFDEIAVGDYYFLDSDYDTRLALEQANYIWSPDIYAGATTSSEWEYPYQKIFYANIILEGIEKVIPKNSGEQLEWNQIKGSALFFRAYNHYNISQLFSKPYDPATASTDLGIPLKIKSDINIRSTRASLQETYEQILNDLKTSVALLTIQKPVILDYKTQTRPNKAAAFAMLARVYLSMSNYDSALLYSDKSLQLYSPLMDFNDPDISSGFPFPIPEFNVEILYFQKGNSYSAFSVPSALVDTNFYKIYASTDLRKDVFYKDLLGGLRYVGEYTQAHAIPFTGLATDEMYLVRAECYARKGNTASALADLNTLYKNRWDINAGPFQPITATNADDALKKIILERRKELCFRGLRWTDLRRLNKDARFAEKLVRVVHGHTYTLNPNSPQYVLPIPPSVIELSGISQNPR